MSGEEGVIEVDVEDLAPGEMRAVAGPGDGILLCNVDGRIYAVSNRCTHASVELSSGSLLGAEIECPFHGARFDVTTGAALCLPAKRGLRSYPVTRSGARVRIEIAPEGEGSRNA